MNEQKFTIVCIIFLFLCMEAVIFFFRENTEINNIIISIGGIMAAVLLTIREVVKNNSNKKD